VAARGGTVNDELKAAIERLKMPNRPREIRSVANVERDDLIRVLEALADAEQENERLRMELAEAELRRVASVMDVTDIINADVAKQWDTTFAEAQRELAEAREAIKALMWRLEDATHSLPSWHEEVESIKGLPAIQKALTIERK
jgi:predicted  nucleic acid-binding Zn-ribbon protein